MFKIKMLQILPGNGVNRVEPVGDEPFRNGSSGSTLLKACLIRRRTRRGPLYASRLCRERKRIYR